jgi:hypothetical protein
VPMIGLRQRNEAFPFDCALAFDSRETWLRVRSHY